MPAPPRPTEMFEVADPAAAFQKLEIFTRRVLAVPKKKIETKPARRKPRKPRRKSD